MNIHITLRAALITTGFLFSISSFGQSALFVDEFGSIGIGTDTPDTIFEINESVLNQEVRMRLTNSANNNYWEYVNRVQVDNAFSINNPKFDKAEMILFPNGNMKISGNYFSGSTQLNVPDYVFKPSYNLMPMQDLQKFISDNSHLPNIPSAAEIKENGINLSTFQLKLLEKIEELALYTLEQHEQISILKDKLVALEQQVNP